LASLTVDSRLCARASLFLVGLAWTLPFLQPYHYYPLTSFYSEWLAFALGLAAATIIVQQARSTSLPVPVVSVAPLGLVAVYLIQVTLGRVPYPEQALTAALYLIWAVLLLILGATLRRELELREIAIALSWSLLVGGVLSALAGVAQHYSIGAPFGQWIAPRVSDAVYGNIGQRNNFADYVALALSALAYLLALGKVGVAFSGAIAMLLLFALVLSGSRTSWLYLALLVALASAYYYRSARRDFQGERLLGFVVFLVAGFLAMHWVTAVPALQLPLALTVETPGGRLLDSALEIAAHGTPAMDPGVETRLRILQGAWLMFLGSPVLGAGLGQFAWHHFQFVAQSGHLASIRFAGEFVDHSHNIVFHLLAETGVVGALVVLGPVAAWFAGLRRRNFDLEHWWLLALLAMIGIHSLLEYPLWYSYFLGIAALLLGIGGTHQIQVGQKASTPYVVAAVLVFGWFHAITVLQSYRDFERLAIRATEAGNIIRGSELKKALASPHRDPVLKPYVEATMSAWMTISPDHLREKLQVNSRAMRVVPIAYLVYRQVFLLALNGQSLEAMQLFDQAARVFPEYLAGVRDELMQLNRVYPGRFSALLDRRAAGFTDSRGARKSDK